MKNSEQDIHSRASQSFLCLMNLREQGFAPGHIAQLLELSEPLVADYLALFDQPATPESRARLTAHLARLTPAVTAEKGGP